MSTLGLVVRVTETLSIMGVLVEKLEAGVPMAVQAATTEVPMGVVAVVVVCMAAAVVAAMGAAAAVVATALPRLTTSRVVMDPILHLAQ